MKIETILKTSQLPLERKSVVNLLYTANMVSDAITSVLKPFDLTLQQFNVLRILRGQKGEPANLFTIQERMINKMSNTTRLVDKLIDKGLVKRNTCKENRRKIEIFITENGLNLLKKIDPEITAQEKKLLGKLNSEQINTLNNYLELIRS